MGLNADATLHSLGYAVVLDASTDASSYDAQGHLNNAAIARVLNDMRIAYIRSVEGPWWTDHLIEHRIVVAVREIHIAYDSEGMPGESYRGGMQYLRREGKGAVFEQCLCDVASGRVIARAWGIQLLVQDGRVVDWPARYFECVEARQGSPVELRAKSTRTWGPGE